MTSYELQDEIYKLMDDIANIKNQLDFAEDDIGQGLEVDKSWMHNAKHAMRKKNIQLLKLNHDLSKVNREEKKLENKTYMLFNSFVSEAKKRLPSDIYDEIMECAKSKAE